MNRAEELAVLLEENARHDEDLETAMLLRKLYEVYEVAAEVVYAKTHPESKAAYSRMIDVITK